MAKRLPDPRQAASFHFINYEFDPASGTLQLHYRFDTGPVLTETLVFPYQPWPQEPGRQQALSRAFELLHLVSGISYYKAGIPSQLIIDGADPGAEMKAFLGNLYTMGLAEFAWVNELQLPEDFEFHHRQDAISYAAPDLGLPHRALLAMGGGKDSLVSVELLRSTDLEVMPACSGESPLIAATVRTAGLPLLQIKRCLAPELFQYNQQGAWNGHVPVTAINSAILMCAALLYGYDSVVFANEKSASSANFIDAQGNEINHQYSKSLEFEVQFQALVHSYISPEIKYFSVLRPFPELAVLGLFSRHPKYHGIFSSCNRHFHQDGSRISGNWCGKCPKCLFIFLGLSVFLEPAEMIGIFGVDLLADADLTTDFAALCGLGGHKPFECVGEVDESRAAVMHLRTKRADSPVINKIADELKDIAPADLATCMELSDQHRVPDQLWEQIRAAG